MQPLFCRAGSYSKVKMMIRCTAALFSTISPTPAAAAYIRSWHSTPRETDNTTNKPTASCNLVKEIDEGAVEPSPHKYVKKEQLFLHSFRNLLLCYPGGVSVDEEGGRIFISDTNHHRIIISNFDGIISDCIGSYPGFEDGEFESAKLSCPAASHYSASDDSLYFIDFQNNAVRRADLEKRLVETVYPSSVKKLQSTAGLWSRILVKLGLASEHDDPIKSQYFNKSLITFPWHLIYIGDNNLLITDHSIETAWIVGMQDHEIREVIEGSPNIMEICWHVIKERVSLLEEICMNWPSIPKEKTLSSEGLLISSVSSFHNHTIFCHADGQRIVKFNRESKEISCICFSNFGVLGVPYWLISPPERVFSSESPNQTWNEHVHLVNVFPGRCDIRVKVEVPPGTELVSPLEESCIWRQIRGSASDISRSNSLSAPPQKVGVAQQWYDELDNLAFTQSEETEFNSSQNNNNDDDKRNLHFDCAVNVSPGTSEVVVSAALYLVIEKAKDNLEEQKCIAMRLLDSRSNDINMKSLFFGNCEDLRDYIFIHPLILRVRVDCADPPAGDLNKEALSTDSSVTINVSL